MSLGSRINEIRKQKDLSLDDLCARSGIPKGTLSKITAGITTKPTLDTVRDIADALECTLDDLADRPTKKDSLSPAEQTHIKKYRALDPYGKEAVDGVLDVEFRRCEAEKQEKDARAAALREQREQMEVAEEVAPESHKVINIFFDEEKSSAGEGYQLDESRLATWKVLYNEFTRKADFCLEVDGRSMEPMIHDGDLILVRQQPAVDIGEIGLFTVNDKGHVKKQGSNRLISVNEEFEDIIPGEYDVVFCRGKVIGVLDPEWIAER